VAQRRANAAREAKKLAKKGQQLRPICIPSRQIATSFWGLAWCDNLEVYADWANRMPRGRTYARNGSIVDLQVGTGEITALVSGSSLYRIQITIGKLSAQKWKAIRADCATQVCSLLDLMRGKLPPSVLRRLSDPRIGMFPHPREIKIRCSCPDYAVLCKHAAAALYGVGHLLDSEPELFFRIRGVDQSELVSDAMSRQQAADSLGLDERSSLAEEDLGAMFGIDLAVPTDEPERSPRKTRSVSARCERAATSKPAGDRARSRTATAQRETPSRRAKTRATAKTTERSNEGATGKKAVKKSTVKKSRSKGVAKK
jgi:uncharacterized Zn finger protein